jgi:hypothetical protein
MHFIHPPLEVLFHSRLDSINFILQLSSYKRKMAAIAEANVSSQGQGQGYQIGNIGGIGPPKEKKQKKQ